MKRSRDSETPHDEGPIGRFGGLLPTLALLQFLAMANSAAADDAGLAVITADAIRDHVAILASDSYTGRLPGTAGEDSTLAYLERQFRSLGLEPIVDGSYRQRVPLVRRTVLPTPEVRLSWVGGGSGAAGRAPLPEIRWADDLLIGSNRLHEHLTVKDAELVFVGYGITAPELGWDDYAGLDMRGKVALALGGDPGRAPGDTTLFGGRGVTHYSLTPTKQETAARNGAVGLITMHDQEVVSYPFSILTAAAGRGKFDLVPGPNATPKTGMGGAIRKEIVQELLRAANLDPDDVMARAGHRGFKGRPLGIAIDISARIHVERSESYNMLGLLRGATRPDEVVAYSAHWDHMGIGVPVAGDSIYNGAVDNASGTAALLTLARAFGALPERPARSLLFWATTCEEQGLLGAYHYADNPVIPLKQTVALINMDALFPFGPVDAMVVTGYGQSELEEMLIPATAPEGRIVIPDGTPEAGAFYRSDHYPMAKKGVPAIFAVGNPRDESDAALMARFTDYVQKSYHQPSDELTDAWDLGGIVQDVRSYYRLGLVLATGDRWPNWRVTSEFRGLRDAMMR